jgi:hypothetical protein
MVHRRSNKLKPPPGLELPHFSAHEMEMVKAQVGELQNQVDVLSKVFLFVDVEQLCRKVEVHSICDGSHARMIPSEVEHDFEDVFSELNDSSITDKGQCSNPSSFQSNATCMDEPGATSSCELLLSAQVEYAISRLASFEEEVAELRDATRKTREAIPDVGGEIVQPISQIFNSKCDALREQMQTKTEAIEGAVSALEHIAEKHAKQIQQVLDQNDRLFHMLGSVVGGPGLPVDSACPQQVKEKKYKAKGKGEH